MFKSFFYYDKRTKAIIYEVEDIIFDCCIYSYVYSTPL